MGESRKCGRSGSYWILVIAYPETCRKISLWKWQAIWGKKNQGILLIATKNSLAQMMNVEIRKIFMTSQAKSESWEIHFGRSLKTENTVRKKFSKQLAVFGRMFQKIKWKMLSKIILLFLLFVNIKIKLFKILQFPLDYESIKFHYLVKYELQQK